MTRQGIFFPLKDAALREDVHVLGTLVGEVIREQAGDALFEMVEAHRQAAIARRQASGSHQHAGAASQPVVMEESPAVAAPASNVPPDVARDLIRAFSAWFQIVNTAEKVHRIRRRRQYLNDGTTPQPGGIEDAINRLKSKGLTPPQIRELLQQLMIEPVLTAHPTESTRRTVLRKQQRVAQLLLGRLGLSRTAAEARVIWERIRGEITSNWQTAENSRERLTVADEREHVLYFLAEVLFKIVPVFYEEVEVALEKAYGQEAASGQVPEFIRFGSWVGGDMDGNPDVHAKTIRETLGRHHQVIVNRYFLDCQQLAEDLSQSATRIGISKRLQARIDNYMTLLPGAQSLTPARHDRMPYRVFLGQVLERLRATYDGRQHQYNSVKQFHDDILIIEESLLENKGLNAGVFAVRRLLRRIHTFGFHLATLDVRQHASVHCDVVAHGLNDPQWLERTAVERAVKLRELLSRDEGPVNSLDAVGKRTLWVFESMAQCRHRFGAQSIGSYIVSRAQGADDVLSVLLLARWADIADRKNDDVPLDVTPLFESAHALENCGQIMTQLFTDPVYLRHLNGRANQQCVMIGYSDSNKELSLVSSRWLVHKAQEALVEAARSANIKLTFLHGRSGIVTRSGSRTETLVRSAPVGAFNGRLRMTEQGEMVNEKYGLRPIALRVFEQAFNCTSLAAAGIIPPEQIESGWREAMDAMAAQSSRAYRALVHDDATFVDFFRQLTPIDVIERMQLGSHLAGREQRTGIAALRGLSWGHAWSQCRYMLPGWFGAGTALRAAREQFGDKLLGEMHANWFFFLNVIDDVELSLARADPGIATLYEGLTDAQYSHFVQLLHDEYALTRDEVLKLRGTAQLLDVEPTVQRSIRLRSPYIDPIHLMQVDLLRRWRAGNREDPELLNALISSVNGIAQGIQGSA
jgi:phosphoenolpyruvate carboxylase